MKSRVVGIAAAVLCLLLQVKGAYAQIEVISASAGYWNYQVTPTSVVTTSVNEQPDPLGRPGVFANFNDHSIGESTAYANIANVPVTIAGPFIQAFLATSPQITLSASALSEIVGDFQGPTANLPFASAFAKISDSIKFCSGAGPGACGPISIGNISAGPSLPQMIINVSYAANLSSKNGSDIGAAIGTSMSVDATFNGAFQGTGLIHQGDRDFTVDSSVSFAFPFFNSNDLNSFIPLSVLTDISASPFSDGSEDVGFTDPITFTLLDGYGNVVPNLFIQSQDGFFYGITDGLLSVVPDSSSATPLPAALPLFATGLGGLALLGWRKKLKVVKETGPSA